METGKVRTLIEDCILLSLRTTTLFKYAEEALSEEEGGILKDTAFLFSDELNKKLIYLEKIIYTEKCEP
ncbi:hypothetical protein L580_0740 [Serratia fonticola AU-P3(3)]|nr:hypothetical protein L580_0740 [Serratia fonticola AU-P3(3)]